MTSPLDAALEALSRDPCAPLDLAEVALLLARDEYPVLDVDAHLGELTAMAREVQPYLRGHLAHQVQGLCRYLFHEMGFRGNPADYYDPRNSYFNQVLERRVGIPISLSAVAMAVGQRAGLTIAGIGLPGHFIVKAIDGTREIIIDPFDGGRILSRADCEQLIHHATGVVVLPGMLELTPIPLGLMIQRMLNNLRTIYQKGQDWPRAVRTLERLRQLSPDDIALRRDLGICRLHNDQPGKAIDHLQAYLHAAGDAEDRAGIEKLLSIARKMIARWN
ncbi:MAG: transglutaminase family protein [Planctomycetes bacterium]|nr:transglutaminase family protein [Planctomycetota bacterium]